MRTGEPVRAASLTSSVLPWDAQVVFEWVEGGKASVQTNLFTVMNITLITDMDFDGDRISSNDVLRSLFPAPDGWAILASPGVRHVVYNETYRLPMPDHYTYTLESTEGSARVWEFGCPPPLQRPIQLVQADRHLPRCQSIVWHACGKNVLDFCCIPVRNRVFYSLNL